MRPFLTRPKKILLIKLRSLGETVLSTASLQALKDAFPDTRIHAAVSSDWASLLVHHPAIDRIWPVDRHEDKLARARSIARAALKLRLENFDCVLNLHASPSSSTLAFATGAKVRAIHFHPGRKNDRYSTLEIPDKGTIKSVLEKDFDVVRALGVPVASEKYRPFITLKPSEMDEGFRLLSSANVPRPVLTIGLGANRPTKCWPLEHFAEVARRWRTAGGGVLLITGPGEADRMSRVLERIGDEEGISHLHAPDLRVLSAVFSQSSVHLGNDSGVKHLAAASGLPTVTLFGPEDPSEWHVYPQDRHPLFYIPDLPCRRDAPPNSPPRCVLEECTVEKHRCMVEISPAEVYEACRRVMK